MSYPILYRADEPDLKKGLVPQHNGIGSLTRIESPVVTEERQGSFMFEFSYYAPSSYEDDYALQIELFNELIKDNVVKAKPNDYDDDRLFRIDEVEFDAVNNKKNVTAIVIAQADLASNSFVRVDLKNSTPSGAFTEMMKKSVVSMPYKAWSDVTEINNFDQSYINVLNSIAGAEGSIIDKWRTEIEWDNFTIRFWKNRGSNRGVRIAYRKNLTGLNLTTTGEVTTRIIPFAKIDNGDGTTREITLKEVVLDAPNVADFFQPLALPVDFSQEMQDAGFTSEAQLRTLAKQWFDKTGNNQPKINIEIDFIQLSRTEEYKNFAALERVALFDTVQVWHEDWGMELEAKVSKYQYDPCDELYISMELGDAKYSLTSRAVNDAEEKQQLENKFNGIHDFINQAIDKATQMITGNDGGYVVLYPPGNPAEIFIMDTDDLNTAQKVLRLNKSGIGFSSTGVNGPYTSAWTLDGAFNASFITSGTLRAIDIQGVNITSSKVHANEFSAEIPIQTTPNGPINGYGSFVVGGDYMQFALKNTSNNMIGQLLMDYNGYYIYNANGDLIGGVSDIKTYSQSFMVPEKSRNGTALYSLYVGVGTDGGGELRVVERDGIPGGGDPNSYVYANVRAKGFVQHSTAARKQDFVEYSNSDKMRALDIIKSSPVYEYRLQDDIAAHKYDKSVGMLAEALPEHLKSDGASVNIYALTSTLWQAFRENEEEKQALEQRLNSLEEVVSTLVEMNEKID